MSSESRDIPQSYLSAKPGDSSTPLGMTTGTKPRRQLGLIDATMIVMGGIVGAGIFANPSEVAHRVHTPFLRSISSCGGIHVRMGTASRHADRRHGCGGSDLCVLFSGAHGNELERRRDCRSHTAHIDWH